MKTRTRKIFRDIIARKGRTLLVVLSIFIGVFGVTVMISLADLIVSQLRADLKPEQIAHNHVYVTSPESSLSLDENQAYLDRLRQLPNVVTVEGQAVYSVYWQPLATEDPSEYTDGFIVAFTEPFDQAKLEPIARLTEGRYPVSGANEIAVEQRFADEYGVEVGDSLRFRPLGQESGSIPTWTVVGLVLHPYFTISPAVGNDIPHEKALYATYADAQQIVGSPGLSAVHLRYTSLEAAQAGADDLQAVLVDETPYVPVFSFFDDPENNFLLDVVSQVTYVFAALGVIAMVVSGFLVTNVITTIVNEQKKQIGVLKSLGASVWDLLAIYTGMALMYGVIGTVLGLVVALPVGGWAAQTLDSAAFTYIDGIKLSAVGAIVGGVMGLLVPVAAAFFPVLSGTRVTILEAMTDFGLGTTWGTSRMSRIIARLPLPHSASQALSNLWQKRGRLALTGLALTFAVAAFMGTTAMVSSLQDVLDSMYNATNYEIGLAPLRAEDSQRISSLLTDQIPEVEDVYPGTQVSVGVEGFESAEPLTSGSNQLPVVGLDPADKAFYFDLLAGTGWQDDPTRWGVIISRVSAQTLDKGAGDQIRLIYGGHSRDYEIIGVNNFPFDQIYMDWREVAAFTGYTDKQGEPVPSFFYVNLKGKPDAKAVDKEIARVAGVLNASGVQASLLNEIQSQDQEAEGINIFGVMFNVMSAVMAAVGAVGLLAALSMAVYERQREIGVMRSIGAGSGTIMTQFLLEGILVGVFAWIAAAPLSYVLGYGLSKVLPFTYVVFRYPPLLLVIGLVGVVMIAALASLWPSLGASRKTVSSILRYQ